MVELAAVVARPAACCAISVHSLEKRRVSGEFSSTHFANDAHLHQESAAVPDGVLIGRRRVILQHGRQVERKKRDRVGLG